MRDDLRLRDLAGAWHLATVLGLTSPLAAHLTDGAAGLLVLAALHQRQYRAAALLTASATAGTAATCLITHL